MHRLRARAACGILAFTCVATTAGAQWSFAASRTSAEFRGLSVVSDKVVWASGQRGTIARSENGGITWLVDTIAGATHLDFRSIYAIDARTAFVASAGEAEKGLAAIYATRDAGKSWQRVYSTDTKGVFFDAIAFWNENHGIALSDPVDSAFFLLETEDGGKSWSRIPAAVLPRVLPGEAAFAASGGSLDLGSGGYIRIGTGGGGRGRVLLSRDYGRSWRVVDTPIHATGGAAGIFGLDFINGGESIAVGGDYTQPNLAAVSVVLSRDGGLTWRAGRAPPAAYLSSVSYEREGNAIVAVGLAGTFVSRDAGESWLHTSTVPLNTVVATSKGWFAVGPAGRLVKATP